MTVDEIVQRVGERSRLLSSGLPVSKPPLGSDFSLNGVVPVPTSFRPAAVLVPLVRREAGITVLLTQRTEDMPSHAGQIAFPGGRTQTEDADAKATALRETEEEVGLSRTFVDVIGAVDPYRTGTGYEITPVVGIVTPGFTIHADPREVADVFEVPLAHFLDDPEPPHRQPRLAGPRAALLRHALRRSLHLGGHGGYAEESALRPEWRLVHVPIEYLMVFRTARVLRAHEAREVASNATQRAVRKRKN